MKIKSVAIIGAGAVGSYIIWGLAQKQDIDLCVVAEGERKERLEKEGLVINDVHYNVMMTSMTNRSREKGTPLKRKRLIVHGILSLQRRLR